MLAIALALTLSQKPQQLDPEALRRTVAVEAAAVERAPDDTEALYLVSQRHDPGAERGLRFDDPAFGIAWPMAPSVISDKDAAWPDFDPAWHGIEQLRGLV